MIATLLRAGRTRVLWVVAALVAAIALADWRVGNRASLGLFYIVPMMVGGTVLSPGEAVVLAIGCSLLRSCFDIPSPRLETMLRFVFALLAYAVSGLFVAAVIRNRKLAVERVGEQQLRKEAEERLQVMVESSPAAILTLDGRGVVRDANRAAARLLLIPPGETLRGRTIGHYLPVLAHALALDVPEGFQTAAQCQGRRENGEVFLANTWFSSYGAPQDRCFAAIVVDSSEELRDREEQGLEQLLKGNRIAAAAVSHEVRNLASAIAAVAASLRERHGLAQDRDFQELANLVNGLERVASVELQWKAQEQVEDVALEEVLDDLRIVIEPDWREIAGAVRWSLPLPLPRVVAERHGLLQAFLNLAQNSYRAVQDCEVRELSVAVSVDERAVAVRFQDSGPGVAAPERLFTPFQPGSDGAGLGLYVSRALVRSYGGELRFVPQPAGTCFLVELQIA